MTGNRAKTAAKLALLVVTNVAAFHPATKSWNAVLMVAAMFVARHAGVKRGDVLGFTKLVILSLPGTFVLFTLSSGDWITATLGAAEFTLALALLGTASFAFWKSTPARDLAMTLRTARVPRSLVLALTVAILFLPVILAGLQRARAYQEARGYRFSLFRLSPLLVPAIVHVLDLSTNLAISLQARGFEP